ncbi:hypothetical protein CEUSTIGMA_g6659.t1 [Chlamydomonas eustigma]|uniref:Threonine dehydratase n=1 Tax=Chlamydomonas eustigma TaxID=1157962 RepID=A0A250X8H4_9CHLO|nr:hypothetical protein CEUSTIGMA_g6659.t1 [Chlamydomonas eustigma]|eukprot:GAX79219.1 hypothetical protein CEUSTIGMA_g6659.t1 [Chlamydomonas eustigma]
MRGQLQNRRSGVDFSVTCSRRAPPRNVITNTSTLGREPDVMVKEQTSSICVPEDLKLKPGELSVIDRRSETLPQDIFRCFGCKRTECKGPAGCASNLWRFQADGYLRAILTARVYDVAVETPLEEAKKLSSAVGNKIMLKREDLQPVFSFKLRGAYNKMAHVDKESLARGVITSSAGNHAQGVALAASKMGCPATICMPVSTPDIKVSNVRRLGGMVEMVGESYQETQTAAVEMSAKDGLMFIPPYDDPFTIAGQGTIGDEIMRQISEPDKLDAIFVPIGGGGLVAGIAAYTKTLWPHVKIIGVEPTGANAMAQSLARGERVILSRVDAFADGVAVKQVGMETFRICRELVDGVVLVDNSATSAAIKDVFNETRSILEPAGALAVAGAKAWLKYNGHEGKTVVAVTSGANMNFERLRLVSELANVGALTEATLTTTLPERKGAFKTFVDTVVEASVAVDELRHRNGGSGADHAAGALPSGSAIQVTEFKYRYSATDAAQVLWGAGIRDQAELSTLVNKLNDADMPTVDISGMESAQLHLRHLVGGRARSYTGRVPDERIYQVTFPEKRRALQKFVASLCAWNVTLFHYRTTGNRESSVLLGVQVPDSDLSRFTEAVAEMPTFSFQELGPKEREVFDRFIQ